MKTHELFESKYLKASDFDKPAVVKIAEVSMQTFLDGSSKALVFFDDLDKPLVLNKTNALAIQKIVGSDDTDQWGGESIRLFATTTDFRGTRVPCIRVEAPSSKLKSNPKAMKKNAVVDEDDDGI